MKKISKILILYQKQFPWEVRIDKFVKSFQANGSQIMVLCRNMGAEKYEENINDIKVRRVGTNFPFVFSIPVPGNIIWNFACRKAIKEFKPDIIIAREITIALPVLAEAKRQNIKVILDMAEHYPEAMRSWKKYAKGIGRFLIHDLKIPDKIEKAVVPKCSGILVVCQEQKDRLINEYGYPKNKIEIIYNTPVINSLPKMSLDTKYEKPYRFGYHGILCDDRDLGTIIRGFNLAAKIDPQITLTIWGGGEVENELQNLALTMENSNRIKFMGRYTPENLNSLYDEIDFGIVSLRKSLFTENTIANKFFDYASLGKPYLFTNLKPLNNIMNDLKCGISFLGGSSESAAEAFAHLRQGNYEEMQKNGVEGIRKKFNWEVDQEKLFHFCDKIINNEEKVIG